MPDYPNSPELIFGLVGPIGCDMDCAEAELSSALRSVRYEPYVINLSDSIERFISEIQPARLPLNTIIKKIDAGNVVCQTFKNNSILAIDAVHQIREIRRRVNEAKKVQKPENDTLENIPAPRIAYIIRQLKRVDEVKLLQKIYGKLFIQISIAQDRAGRLSRLIETTRNQQPSLRPDQWESVAVQAIRRDEDERLMNLDSGSLDFGQRVGDIFQSGDLFVNTARRDEAKLTVSRFIEALFGKNDISPTKDEYGTYLAKSASLRSVDLSRQVGAALLSSAGDVISLGCNDVPKPLGGNYWDEDNEKHRDIDRRSEANKDEINRIIHDFFKVLESKSVFDETFNWETELERDEFRKSVTDSLIGGITEYGRMVHAEMNAVSDAARLGRALAGSILYVTTFPCHNCAKHLIASGIVRIVYIEPYPKSRTELLYGDAIATRSGDSNRVVLEHFSGISPRRYRDIFEKGKRRGPNGKIEEWYQNTCEPQVGNQVINHALAEVSAFRQNTPT